MGHKSADNHLDEYQITKGRISFIKPDSKLIYAVTTSFFLRSLLWHVALIVATALWWILLTVVFSFLYKGFQVGGDLGDFTVLTFIGLLISYAMHGDLVIFLFLIMLIVIPTILYLPVCYYMMVGWLEHTYQEGGLYLLKNTKKEPRSYEGSQDLSEDNPVAFMRPSFVRVTKLMGSLVLRSTLIYILVSLVLGIVVGLTSYILSIFNLPLITGLAAAIKAAEDYAIVSFMEWMFGLALSWAVTYISVRWTLGTVYSDFSVHLLANPKPYEPVMSFDWSKNQAQG